MKLKIFTTFFIAAFASCAYAQAYKCKSDSGKVTYQEQPCAHTEKSQELKIQRAPEMSEDEKRISLAIATRKVTRGMTASQVRQAWGDPTSINRSVGSYGSHEQWVYDRGNFRSQYIYLQNGVVSSMQSPGE